MKDFQQHPHWPVHYFDDYKTWYAYGASLYLFFLEQRYFQGNPRFLAQLWQGSRNRPRPFNPKTGLPDPASNEPDWVDALENLLPRGTDYTSTVAEFARWRWYTGRHSDGRHFHEGALLSPQGEVRLSGSLGPQQRSWQGPGPLLGGSVYLKLKAPSGTGKTRLRLTADPQARWVYQLVPGLEPGSDGEFLPASGEVRWGSGSERVLIATALPQPGVDWDPDLPAGQALRLQVQWLQD